MPKYSFNISELIYEEEAKKILERAKDKKEATLISIAWLFGARTTEIILLTRENIDYNSDQLSIKFKTLKLKEKESYQIKDRILTVSRPRPEFNIFVETIIDYISSILPENRILPYTPRWAQKIFNKCSEEAINKKITPYHFRHSCFTWLAVNGASENQIKYWKGADSIDSVAPYLKAVPVYIKLENFKRTKQLNIEKEKSISNIV